MVAAWTASARRAFAWLDPAGRLGRVLTSGLLAAVAMAAGLAVQERASQPWARFSFDFTSRLLPARPPGDLVIVALDEASHQQLRQPTDRPWDRRLHAALLRRLQADGARLVLFDILFDQPGPDPAADAELAAALRDFGHALLVAGVQVEERGAFDAATALQTSVLAPLPEFRRAVQEGTERGWGLAQLAADGDFGVRRLHVGEERIASLTWLAARRLHPGDPALEPAARAAAGAGWLNYGLRPADVPAVSFAQAVAPADLPAGFFRDKVVFVGTRLSVSYTGRVKDSYLTPFGYVDGVAIHAVTLENLRGGHWLRRWAPAAENWALAGAAFALGALIGLGGPVAGFATALAASALVLSGGVLLAQQGLFVPTFPLALVAVPTALVWSVGGQYYREARRRARIKRLFATFVAPTVVESILASGRDPALGGQRREITALFSDVEGFSAFSLELEPAALVDLMNEYLAAMTEAVFAERGTLDKYIGDAIVAIYNAPVDLPGHAARACAAALEMHRRQKDLRARWAAGPRPWPPRVLAMRTRVGLNTGPAVVGYMGSEVRKAYTMMGDTVNLAARLEGAGKEYGVYTLVGADTVAAIGPGHPFLLRALDCIVAKGRPAPVEIYELLGRLDGANARQLALVELYEQARTRYLARDWAAAETLFQRAEACEGEPGGPPPKVTASAVLAARCRAYAAAPPPDDWRGEHIMTSK